jgi:probable DNA repair protein
VLDAIAAGAAIVTPNRRLARALRRHYERAQLAAGLRAWATPSILPYAEWARVLWRSLPDAAPLLDEAQSAWLWTRVVTESRLPLLDLPGAARMAAEAWRRLHAWREPGESWRSWRAFDTDNAEVADDAARFAGWADAYDRLRARSDSLDDATVGDALAAATGVGAGMRARLVGFIELSSQQQRLVDALVARGAAIDIATAPPAQSAASVVQMPAAHIRDELHAAFSWARDRVLANEAADIGIVVPDLQSRRSEVIALADQLLAPASLLSTGHARPYQVSLGIPLRDVPLVASALDLIALLHGALPAGTAATLLRSPYLDPGGAATLGAVEREWLDGGVAEVSLDRAASVLVRAATGLGARWRAFADARRPTKRAPPRQWAEEWRAWLDASAWPGTRSLDSAEFQAHAAWSELLADFAALAAVARQLDADEALGMLRTLASSRLFQPEGSAVPIVVLGTLEASGLSFDALWVSGMQADRWPPPPQPDPLLPLAWQRVRRVPNASAASALARARKITEGFAAAADEVVFSYPATVDDYRAAPSALIEAYPAVEMKTRVPRYAEVVAASADIECIADDRAPPLPAEAGVRGGTGVIAAQSACPFQAFARYRLELEPWPAPLDGWSPMERGILLHAAMAELWRAANDQSTLEQWSSAETDTQVKAAIDAAFAEWRQKKPARARTLSALVLDAEAERLTRVMRVWLDIDRARPPFAVRDIEAKSEVLLARRGFNVRLDRVDVLAGGGLAVIDYKSGKADAPSTWFRPRPCGTQIGMYTLALAQREHAAAVRAAAFASMHVDEVRPVGMAFDEAAWPQLRSKRGFDWGRARDEWQRRLDQLAGAFVDGDAIVDPRSKPRPCGQCGLQPLCRIDGVHDPAEDGDTDE